MITKTSREVLIHALQLAGVNNMGFMDFFNSITLINNAYRTIYERIAAQEDGYYDKECIFSGNRFCLPSDMWMIKRVIRMQGDIEAFDLLRQAGHTTTAGQYLIRDGELIINERENYTYKIIYTPAPATITIPEDPVLTSLNVANIDLLGSKMDEEYFYYKNTADEGSYHRYNLTTGLDEKTADAEGTNEHDYLGGVLTVDNQAKTYSFSKDGEVTDVKEVLSCEKEIDFVCVSDPYIAVTYIDKSIKIFNGWCGTDYNIFAYKGKATKGKIIGMYTNDYTGKGVIFVNNEDKKAYYASFVPDTVLNYPEQADFSLLEWMVASDLSQMAGTESDWINNKLELAKMDFERQLQRCRASTLRVNNVRNHTFYGFR